MWNPPIVLSSRFSYIARLKPHISAADQGVSDKLGAEVSVSRTLRSSIGNLVITSRNKQANAFRLSNNSVIVNLLNVD